MKVKLHDVVKSIELGSEESEYYYNTENGEIVTYEDPLITGINDEGLEEELKENDNKYIPLPTKTYYEFHIRGEFILNMPEGEVNDRLDRAIESGDAFRRFAVEIHELGIEKEWLEFQAEYFKKLAIGWCNDHKIEYW